MEISIISKTGSLLGRIFYHQEQEIPRVITSNGRIFIHFGFPKNFFLETEPVEINIDSQRLFIVGEEQDYF